MNPGISEEAGKVASTTVEALKQTPLVLALVIFNVLFMFVVLYFSIKNGDRFDGELTRMHELTAKVMATCGPHG